MKLDHANDSSVSDLALARANYENWFQNKVLASTRDTRPLISHEKVISEVEAIIYKAELKNIGAKPATLPP